MISVGFFTKTRGVEQPNRLPWCSSENSASTMGSSAFNRGMKGETNNNGTEAPPVVWRDHSKTRKVTKSTFSLDETVFFGIDTGHLFESLCRHVVRDLGIDLESLDIGVSQHAAGDPRRMPCDSVLVVANVT